ncbi:hypothetical protein C0992_003222 [Termitomyces sp. T32_za158]|nr:hypothetical protein C0992_003222 [Termitomyces sp. T32_za158]
MPGTQGDSDSSDDVFYDADDPEMTNGRGAKFKEVHYGLLIMIRNPGEDIWIERVISSSACTENNVSYDEISAGLFDSEEVDKRAVTYYSNP